MNRLFARFEKIREWFERYVGAFDLSVPMIQMKYTHSRDVMKVGETLTRALEWPSDAAEVGVSACLLHDTGRFSQYRDFGTYYDGASVDHGERGFEVLLSDFPSEAADAEAREVLLQAVRWHNKKNLPKLTPEVMPFCRLVRDADKLDVFYLVRRRMDEGTVGDLLPRHKIDAPLSETLLHEVEEHWSGTYKNASSLLDFTLIQLTWALDINFTPSLQMLEDSGMLTRMRSQFPKEPRIQALLERLFVRVADHKRALVSRNEQPAFGRASTAPSV
ncbi:MAG: HD domain-containing protein [Synergistaceae bacterium]|nr:HD domain-containing protein [Synergistaceae bacterium]